jgi:molybdate transport repressor ModE-like protein
MARSRPTPPPTARRTSAPDPNLAYLHAIALLGSMRAAADSLGIAVSSVSRQIAQLEREFGVALVERGGRAARLTEAGTVLLDFYRDRLVQRERLDQRLADLRGARTGRVEVAIGEGFIGELLSAMLSRFVTDSPGLTVDVQMTASSNDAARLVAEDEAHVALVFQALQDPRVRSAGSAAQSLCVVTPAGHPLAAVESVKLKDLDAYRLCLPDASFRTRQLLRAVESAENYLLRPSITTNSLALMKSLVRAGEFCTLLPELAVHEELDRGEFVTVRLATDLLPETAIHVLQRVGRPLSPAVLSLIDELNRFLRGCVERVRAARTHAAAAGRGRGRDPTVRAARRRAPD